MSLTNVLLRCACLVASLVLALGCEPKRSQLEASGSRSGNVGSWPQWRGTHNLGVLAEGALPTTWSSDSANVRWTAAVPGKGNSSPIVSRGRVLLTTAISLAGGSRDAQPEIETSVLAYDLETGEKLWHTSLGKRRPHPHHRVNTLAAPTPATDGEIVAAYFGPQLAALDLDGKLLWQRDLESGHAEFSRYGASSSPLLAGDRIVVAQDQESGRDDDVGWLAAFATSDGRQLWRTEWDETCCSYSSPVLASIAASDGRLLFAHSGSISEYDLSDGKPLWVQGYDILQLVSTPVWQGDLLGIAGGAHNVKETVVFRLSGTGADTRLEKVWGSQQGAPQTSSPLLYDGRLFMLTQQGVMSCYEFESGSLLWRERMRQGPYRASLVGGDGKVFAFSERGRTLVVAAADDFELLADNESGLGGNASPALIPGSLLLRTHDKLLRIDAEGSATEP